LCRPGRRWFFVGVGPEPDRDTRGDERLALEEIRALFARYREIARDAMAVTEHDEQAEEPEEAPAAR
jgi:hypothetical protein